MTEVAVLFLDQTFSSTAIGPMEVFRHAGTLWNILTDTQPVPRFRVTTVSADGRAVCCDGPIHIKPMASLKEVRRTDLIFIPTTGLVIDDVVERNAPVVPWLRRWHKRGAAIASVCSGVGLVAASGLLDGKRATTHWGLAEKFRGMYPKVKWMPELMVTEDGGFYCGGGVHAALDLSLYLVEKFCGHDVAIQTAKALLIETPRAWQSGFAIVPLKTEHNDDAISRAQEWLHENFHEPFPLEAPARRVGMSLRNFVRRFKLATGDSPLIYCRNYAWPPPSACWRATIAACRRSVRRSAIKTWHFSARSFSGMPEFHPADIGRSSECNQPSLPVWARIYRPL
jgi:transcriptional regulator GlxA family with amidase domain